MGDKANFPRASKQPEQMLNDVNLVPTHTITLCNNRNKPPAV